MRALVTGGSGALGNATSRALGAAGHGVVVGYRTNRNAAERLAQELRNRGTPSIALGFDVVDVRATEAAVTRAAEELGGLDILVHAAAQSVDGLAADLAGC